MGLPPRVGAPDGAGRRRGDFGVPVLSSEARGQIADLHCDQECEKNRLYLQGELLDDRPWNFKRIGVKTDMRYDQSHALLELNSK
jgi:hypothetical protein